MATLILSCPHCEEEHQDAFEVLNADSIESMRCDACNKQFWFAIMECHRCANEQTFTWTQLPTLEVPDGLTCEACGSTFRYHDDTSEPEI